MHSATVNRRRFSHILPHKLTSAMSVILSNKLSPICHIRFSRTQRVFGRICSCRVRDSREEIINCALYATAWFCVCAGVCMGGCVCGGGVVCVCVWVCVLLRSRSHRSNWACGEHINQISTTSCEVRMLLERSCKHSRPLNASIVCVCVCIFSCEWFHIIHYNILEQSAAR